MRRHFVLVVLVVLVSAAPALAGQKGLTPTVDGSVQVTNDPGASRAHTVPAVAVDPRHDNVLAIAEADAYSSQCAVHVSTNAGLSWTSASSPKVAGDWPNCSFVPFGPVVDVAFGPDGTLYYAFSGFNPITKKARVFLARSHDLGTTWDTTMLPWIAPNPDKGETGIDAVPSIAVDPHNADHVWVGWGSNWATYTLTADVLQGKLYYWDVVERVYVAASTDGGKTFGDPVDRKSVV